MFIPPQAVLDMLPKSSVFVIAPARRFLWAAALVTMAGSTHSVESSGTLAACGRQLPGLSSAKIELAAGQKDQYAADGASRRSTARDRCVYLRGRAVRSSTAVRSAGLRHPAAAVLSKYWAPSLKSVPRHRGTVHLAVRHSVLSRRLKCVDADCGPFLLLSAEYALLRRLQV